MAKGLSHRFNVISGKITLTSGSTKAKDNIYFLMLFDTVSRIYRDDFAPKLLWLIQKPSSFVEIARPLLLGRLRKVVLKYVLDINVESIDLNYFRQTAEKRYEINVIYKYVGTDDENTIDTAVRFI